MLVALERLPNQRVLISDDDGYTVTLADADWGRVLALPTGQQRAAVERIVSDREQQTEGEDAC